MLSRSEKLKKYPRKRTKVTERKQDNSFYRIKVEIKAYLFRNNKAKETSESYPLGLLVDCSRDKNQSTVKKRVNSFSL